MRIIHRKAARKAQRKVQRQQGQRARQLHNLVAPSLTPSQRLPSSGTVVLDVEEGGIAVPSFLGKNLRVAIEAAQDAGLDLDAIGSGVAREQTPQPGARVAVGSRVTVRFGR
jgi:cell division protein FtsI (penicillin-binding protein 3)